MHRNLLLVAALAFSSAATADEPLRHVVLVSVDGLSASYLNDERAKMPNLRAIASQGAQARGMLTSFPSVTWPSHTSLVTGSHPARHGVIGNSVWNRETDSQVTYIGDPVLTKNEAIRIPTLYDRAHQSGLTTASVIWPCSNGAETLDFVIPDSNKPAIHLQYTTPGFANELADASIDISPLGAWGWGKEYSTPRDVLYTRVTQHLLKRHNVNLILVHLITPDGVQHAYGPQTPPAFDAVAESDQRLGEIWETLQQPPFVDNSAMFVVSDHGFAAYSQFIRPNALLRQLGMIETDEAGKVVGRKAWCVAQGGSAFIYRLDVSDDGEWDSVVEKLGQIDGVQSLVHPQQFAAFGLADPSENPEAPHLVLSALPGYSFANQVDGQVVVDAGGTKGSHGHDPRPPYMHALFVAAGEGIKPGTKLDVIRNIDVAPTIAHLLGFEMECQGEILQEILTDAP